MKSKTYTSITKKNSRANINNEIKILQIESNKWNRASIQMYTSLDLFYFVNLTSSCSLIPLVTSEFEVSTFLLILSARLLNGDGKIIIK